MRLSGKGKGLLWMSGDKRGKKQKTSILECYNIQHKQRQTFLQGIRVLRFLLKINMEEMEPSYSLYHSTKATEQSLMSKFDSDRIRAGFSELPVPHREPCTQLRKEVYFHCHLKLQSLAFSGRMGQHEKQQCHQAGCKEMQCIFERELWSTSVG